MNSETVIKNAKIIKILSNTYTVKYDDNILECKARGKFRNDKITPLVGDNCLVDINNRYIMEILPRKNTLKRPLIANIDLVLIVTSVKSPNFSSNLLDKLLSLSLMNKVIPIICLTKLDLLTKEEKKNLKSIIKYYKSIGFKVVKNTEINKIKHLLKNKLVVLAGQTGAGKSSLLNRLNNNLHIKTGEISEALGRGKHTTRHVEIYEFNNMFIADTPGFSALDLDDFTEEEIKASFLEFQKYNCAFKDCKHINEKDCGVKKALADNKILLSRYNNYLHFIKK